MLETLRTPLEQERVDRLADQLRTAYYRASWNNHVVPYKDAHPDERSAWRAVAAAAINMLDAP